jgi:hypothetical protein
LKELLGNWSRITTAIAQFCRQAATATVIDLANRLGFDDRNCSHPSTDDATGETNIRIEASGDSKTGSLESTTEAESNYLTQRRSLAIRCAG